MQRRTSEDQQKEEMRQRMDITRVSATDLLMGNLTTGITAGTEKNPRTGEIEIEIVTVTVTVIEKDLKGLIERTETAREKENIEIETKIKTKIKTRKGTETGIGMWTEGDVARMETRNAIMRKSEREIQTESTAKIGLTARAGIMNHTTESQAGAEMEKKKEKENENEKEREKEIIGMYGAFPSKWRLTLFLFL